MLSLVGAWTAVHLRQPIAYSTLPLALGRWLQAPVTLVLIALIYVQALWQPFDAAAGDRPHARHARLGRAAARGRDASRATTSVAWVATAGDYGLMGELAAYDGSMATVGAADRDCRGRAAMGFLPPLTAETLRGQGSVRRARTSEPRPRGALLCEPRIDRGSAADAGRRSARAVRRSIASRGH